MKYFIWFSSRNKIDNEYINQGWLMIIKGTYITMCVQISNPISTSYDFQHIVIIYSWIIPYNKKYSALVTFYV